jgi:TonB family protein
MVRRLFPLSSVQDSLPRIALLVLLILLLAVLAPILRSQETGVRSQETGAQPPSPGKPGDAASDGDASARITESALDARLGGKQLFLRVFDLSNDMKFDENGKLQDAPEPGPFTLCAFDVKRVHLTKRKLEISGYRMGLHFFGALSNQGDNRQYELIRLSKKPMRISIDRELVVIPKKKKEDARDKASKQQVANPEPAPPTPADRAGFASEASPSEALPGAQAAPVAIAAVPDDTSAVQPGEPTTTTSPAHAARLLNEAIDRIFSERLDESYVRNLPDFWRQYFAAKAGGTAANSAISQAVLPGPDVTSPKIVSSLEPGSNEFAQKYNIAGMALFQTVVDPQGHPEVLAVAQPIGFGLDERAVEAIRKASFEPGLQNGKAVPVMVDLRVTFRIYSNRTRGSAVENISEKQKAEAALSPR